MNEIDQRTKTWAEGVVGYLAYVSNEELPGWLLKKLLAAYQRGRDDQKQAQA